MPSEKLRSFGSLRTRKLVSLGGNLRKVRISRESGGFRTICLFGGRDMPIFLISVFAKSEEANLMPKEQAAAVELGKEIGTMWRDKK